MKVIILAGGSGTRLWPISRSALPKQFLTFGEELSLLQRTVARFRGEDITIVTGPEYAPLVERQLAAPRIIVEPARKNTAPAILLALQQLEMADDEPVVIAPSDHWISPEGRFLEAMAAGAKMAREGFLVTFGVKPRKAETGYGYIQVKEGRAVAFREKPSLSEAEQYLLSGDYLWNSGILVTTPRTFFAELTMHAPELAACTDFMEMPNISIDYALLEKSSRLAVVPLDLFWSDVGSWDTIFEMLTKDQDQNATVGNVVAIDTKNSLIIGGKKLISTVGLEDVVIIETDDAIFFTKRGESQRVKAVVEELERRGCKR